MIELLVQRIKQQQSEIATSVMRMPKDNHADHMLMIGRWQGLQESLDILDEIIRDQDVD